MRILQHELVVRLRGEGGVEVPVGGLQAVFFELPEANLILDCYWQERFLVANNISDWGEGRSIKK